jgi:glycosyltransferase involved in cell wall biosynthesis
VRIVILTRYYPPRNTEGIPRTRWLYAREFVKLGHEVHVITSGHEGFETIEDGVYLHYISAEDLPDIPGIPDVDPTLNTILRYSQAVYRRLQRLHNQLGVDLIDSPLWDLEGYIVKLRLPEVPLVLRLETTSMQLEEIHTGKRLSTGPVRLLHRFEANFLQIADALVFDSWSIVDEVRRLYRVDIAAKPHAIIHHGIETEGLSLPPQSPRSTSGRMQVLSVGRLEKRKGTDLLIGTIIPKVLSVTQVVDFHLVGRDCAADDGFRHETGLDYRGYLMQKAPSALDTRVFMHGYLPDELLEQRYREADLVLCLARYESFGLQYLEGMRTGRPVIAFESGAAPEIITKDKDGILVPLEDAYGAIREILRLLDAPEERVRIGEAGFHRLVSTFSSRAMAERCAAFFEQLLAARRHERRIIQIMDFLAERDGVSSIAINYHKLLRSSGYQAYLTGRAAAPGISELHTPREALSIRKDDILLYHYWNYNESALQDAELSSRKALLFHNITDPAFFDRNHPAFEATSKGYRQLRELSRFDQYASFSSFSATVLQMTFGLNLPVRVLTPFFDADAIRSAQYDIELLSNLRRRQELKILFVGRVIPHKRQEDLIRFLQAYRKAHGPEVHLFLVGPHDPGYVSVLQQLINELGLNGSVSLPGSVPDEALQSYFRGCDAYISMSEHEGFGLPLVTAMVFGLPVFAYAKGAVAETLGDTGCLFRHKRFPEVAELVHQVLSNKSVREHVREKQNQRLEAYRPQQAAEQLHRLVRDLELAQ